MKTYEEIKLMVEESQQSVCYSFGAGVEFVSKYKVEPRSSLAEDQVLSVEINKLLSCIKNIQLVDQFMNNLHKHFGRVRKVKRFYSMNQIVINSKKGS